MLTMVCLVLALGLPSLALRGYVKLQVRKVIAVDDWIMLLASVSTPFSVDFFPRSFQSQIAAPRSSLQVAFSSAAPPQTAADAPHTARLYSCRAYSGDAWTAVR